MPLLQVLLVGTMLAHVKGQIMQTSIKVRISKELKDNANHVLSDCGLNVSTAIRLFTRTSC
ncbi:type II toxin-antitoxin system RelB/DinJ family antitoxin [Acerihabitans sp. KWT182]|uniref:Type II toxin-antitoxin system RelB/DinJ family antitoxin n=1 Tax=Acerihabitans sp. KWT182 TaxID=3157919 RepID=A0AAU7QF76_9GAMM